MGKKKDKIKYLERDVKNLANENARLRLRMDKMVDESELALIHEAYAEQMRALEEEIRWFRSQIAGQ